MGNGVSRVVGCFVPGTHDQEKFPVYFSEPLDEGLGHSFCYVRPVSDSPHPSPPHSDRFLSVSLPLDSSDASNGSLQLNHENVEYSQKLKILSETSFKSISGASVSANTSTPRTIASREQFSSFANVLDDRAAAFESTSSFTALPLQPVPKGLSQSGPITESQIGQASGPLDRGFLSGPLERGFMSGPIERGFLSGPLERGCMSGPMEATDRSIFSAPLAGPYASYLRRRRRSLAYLVRTFGNPVKKVLSRSLSKTTSTFARTQRSLGAPVKFVWGQAKYLTREGTTHHECPLDFGYTSSDLDSREVHNVQWAQGKAGEDRVHVVLSEEHGWLFVGIYDGFNGPDAPDYLMSNLYHEIYKELRGLLWDREKGVMEERQQGVENKCDASRDGLDKDNGYGKASFCRFSPHEEVRNAGAGSQGLWNDLNSDRKSSVSKEAPRPRDDEEFVRLDNESESAELDGPSYPAGGHEISSAQVGSGETGCEIPSHAITDISETRVQQSLTVDIKTDHKLENPQDLFAPNTFKKRVESTNLNFHCKGNEGTERVSGEGHNFHQNTQISRLGKQRKIWAGRTLFKLKLKKASTKGNKSCKGLGTCGLEWEQDQKGGQRKSDDNYKQGTDKPCKNGNADHNGVLEALARALESTEREYLQMADGSIEETPELALMGSCVLVMLMKGEDAYVMNVGDSRAILAQLKSDPQPPSFSRDPAVCQVEECERNGARDSQLRQELERIMEENPTELETFESSHTSSSTGPPATSLLLSALQLSSDHSTSIDEEVHRIKAEHPDDKKSISNERVKGRLKVTRAFGAGFLKLPRWNNALLEMFRVDYVGTAPYVTCKPSLCHHLLGPNDRFLVLSSDGLYQYLTNEEVVSHVEWFMDKFPDGDPAQHLIEELLFRAAKKAGMDFHELLDIPQGDRRKYHDDVSVMVISLEGRIWRSFG